MLKERMVAFVRAQTHDWQTSTDYESDVPLTYVTGNMLESKQYIRILQEFSIKYKLIYETNQL